jgi:hypothetical protein
MTESDSGQSFHRSTFGGQQGEVGNGQTTGTQREGQQDGQEERREGVGTVVEVKGPVVDVRFPPEEIPEIYNALTVNIHTGEEEPTTLSARWPWPLPTACSAASTCRTQAAR